MSRWGTGVGVVIVATAGFGVWQLFQTGKEPVANEDAVTDVIPEVEVAVQTGTVTRTNLFASVLAYGSVEAAPAYGGAPAARVSVTAPSAGIVAEALCAVGSRVRRNDALFRMDTRLADLAVQKAQQAFAFAQLGVDRQSKLQKIDGTSEKTVQEAQMQLDAARQELAAAQTERSLLSVSAPIDGTVMRVTAPAGTTVDAGTELAELVDLKRLVLSASLPSSEAALVKTGALAMIDAGGQTPGTSLKGEVNYIEPQVDSQSGTVKLRVSIPVDTGLRLGQFARVRIITAELRGCLAVPEESLEHTDDGHVILRVVEGSEAVPVMVETGVSECGWVEVRGEGLASGTPIVTVGGYGLEERTRIRAVTP